MVSAKKHSSGKPQPSSHSGKDKVSVTRELGEALVGSRVRVWWPIDRKFYEGVVESYASSQKKHRVLYDDGDEEKLNMNKEKWELIEEEDDDAEADAEEIALQDESGDESSDAIPEPKKAISNGKSSEKGKMVDEMPHKKQKIDSSAKSKSEVSGMKGEESEEEKPKKGRKKAEKSKDAEKEIPKPETEKNGEMGNIGGKIVAAASRMSGRFRTKENGQEKEVQNAVKTSKKVAESNRRNLKRASSSSGSAENVKKSRTSSKEIKSNSVDEEVADDEETSDEEPKARVLRSSKKEPNNPKQKKASAAVASGKGNRPKASSKNIKSNSSDVENGDEKRNRDSSDNEEGKEVEEDTSADESKPLVSFLKKSPEAIEVLMDKLKGKKKEAGEESSSGNETEAGEESS